VKENRLITSYFVPYSDPAQFKFPQLENQYLQQDLGGLNITNSNAGLNTILNVTSNAGLNENKIE